MSYADCMLKSVSFRKTKGNKMQMKTLILTCLTVLTLSACGTLTGIPSHGGGKRFAVEQELVAASARAAAKDMDLRPLAGRRVAVHIAAMGDQGAGVLSGGRYSIDALIRGEYANTPSSVAEYAYPNSVTTAVTDAGGLTSTTSSTSVLNAPSSSRTRLHGNRNNGGIGLSFGGMGNYANETLTTNPRDATFLSNLIQTVFFLRGIEIVPDELADTDVFVNVDVFGTIRSRTELHLYNAETLKAQTKFEYFAVDRRSKRIVSEPKTSAYEASYRENYALWTGPYKIQKTVKPADGLMVDFSDITPYGSPSPAAEAAGERRERQTMEADADTGLPADGRMLRKHRPDHR